MSQQSLNIVANLYRKILCRECDEGGRLRYASMIDDGELIGSICDIFTSSEEFIKKDIAKPTIRSHDDVNDIYMKVIKRPCTELEYSEHITSPNATIYRSLVSSTTCIRMARDFVDRNTNVNMVASEVSRTQTLTNNKKAVFTTIFGDNDTGFGQKIPTSPNVDYFFITSIKNKEIHTIDPLWTVILIDPKELLMEEHEIIPTDTLASRVIKLLSHRIFKGYTHTIYMDCNIKVFCDLTGFFKLVNTTTPVAVFEHPDRNCVFEEVLEIEKSKKLFRKKGVPKFIDEFGSIFKGGEPMGMSWNCFLIRRNSPKLEHLENIWFYYYVTVMHRDQPIFPVSAYGTSTNIKILPLCYDNPTVDNSGKDWAYPHLDFMNMFVGRAGHKDDK